MANSASHAALPYPIKGARYTIQVPYLDADGDPTDPTTPDTEISEDGGAFTDCAEEVTTISGSNGCGYITVSGAETDNSMFALAFKVASGPKATIGTFYPRVLASVGTGTLSAGSAGGGTLGTLLAYDVTGCFIKTTGGTGGGGTGGANNQVRKIVTYNTSTGAFTVTPNWETTPSTDTTYDVLLPEGVTLGMLKTLNPTTAGRTLDVSTGGEAGVDWANVGSPTTTLNLSGTTVKTATDVETDTADIQSRLPAALVNSRMDCTIDGTGMETGAVDAILNRDASASTTNSTLGAIINDWENGGRLDLIVDDILVDTGTTIPGTLGTPSDLGNGATIAFNLSDIHTDTAAIDAIASKLSGLVMASEVIGSTGNSTTAVHLSTLTYGNDEINDHLLVIYDNSTGEFHARWITAWSNASKLATVATLPFTPENAVDTYYLTSLRRDMTASTVSDKTGYSISGTTTTLDALQTALNSAHGAGSWATATGFSTHSAADVWAAGTRTLTAATNISGPIADQVWEEAIADHSGTAGSTAEALNAAGAAGDPWTTALPGAYGAGSAGYIIGNNINATVSSRASQTSVDTIDGIVDAILVDTAEIGAAGAGLTAIQLPSNGLANVTAWTVAITGNITGNLSGSVGSVTGAVGSVTGNVGGNVTGSVGSVLGGINTTAGVITTLDGLDTAQDSQHSTTQGLVTTVDAVVDSILVDTTQIKADLPTRPTKNVALANFPFVMRLTSDHVTGATGKTITATRRIDSGSFASCANSASEVSNGVYTINLAAADLNGDTILLRFTAADCDDTFILVVTQP